MNGSGLSDGARTLSGPPVDVSIGQVVRLDLRGDARSFAVARAFQLGVFASAPTSFEDPFTAPPLTSPSQWLRNIVANGTIAQLAEERGGVVRISSGNGAPFSTQTVSLGPTAGPLTGLIKDPGSNGSRWYVLWIFRVPAAVDNQTSLLMNVIGVVNTPSELFFGVDGRFGSTTKLVAEWSDNTTTITPTLSTINIAPGTWHYLEAYQRGDGSRCFFAYDGEPELTQVISAPFNHSATIQLTSDNGTTLTTRSMDHDHMVLLMDNNVVLNVP